jgi:hypothetical protein
MTPFDPIVCVVGFHHARFGNPFLAAFAIISRRLRGPEVETWIGVEEGQDPATENEWPLLPFMALSDGAHTYV